MSHDRVECDEFPMTHEFMAELLGVRRQTVTVTAGLLQEAGLVNFRRGYIRIVDRLRLEEAACECYGVIRALYERVFP
jgi:CRP-like cAMP-binding protein